MNLKRAGVQWLKSHKVGCKIYPVIQYCYRLWSVPHKRHRLARCGDGVLERLHHCFEKNQITYYCDYGTLLGFIREQGFLLHDDDIDISIPCGTKSPAEVLQKMLEDGYSFVHAFEYEGRVLEFTVADKTGVTIDVFFPKRAREGILYAYQPVWFPTVNYPSEKANTLIQYEFVAPTRVVSMFIRGVSVLVPENADEVLASEYGNWRVPDTRFSTVDDRVHREMSGFAFRLTQTEVLQYKGK